MQLSCLGSWFSARRSRWGEASDTTLDAFYRYTLIEASHAASRNLALLRQFGYGVMDFMQSNAYCRSYFRIKQLTMFFQVQEN